MSPKYTKDLWSRVAFGSSCWLWTGFVSESGYGRMGSRLAHRVVYEALVGPIPAGLQLDHLCRNRRCVRPDHLEPVTTGENTRRGLRGRRPPVARCRRGHAIEGDNIYFRPNRGNSRECRRCRTEQTRQRRARLAA